MGKLGVGRLAVGSRLCMYLNLCTSVVLCINPFIQHRYAADPAAHIWDAEDRMYVYASWDNPEAVSHDSMDRYHVYSSVDLVAWVDHGYVALLSGRPQKHMPQDGAALGQRQLGGGQNVGT